MKDNYEKIRRLMLASNQMDGGYYLFARKAGIRENTLALLYALDDGSPHSQKQVCEEWLIPKTTINSIIQELTREGYVTLATAEGTREKTICLTESGQAYASRILEGIYEAEQSALRRTLEQYSDEFISAFECFTRYLCEGLADAETAEVKEEKQKGRTT